MHENNKSSDFPSPSKMGSPNDDSMNSNSASEKKKKARTTFTGRQIFELEKQFEVKKYLSLNERAKMATLLNVTETQVRDCLDFISFVQYNNFNYLITFTHL